MKTELTNMKITHVSYVKKGANKKQFFLMKSENNEPAFEKQVDIFFKKSDDKKLVYGIVYEPNMLDTDNEFANEIEIEKAAHEFLVDSRNIDLQHNFQKDYGAVVESYIAPADFKIDKSEIKKGSWILVTKATDEVWQQIQKGDITGYSMAGNATKVPIEDNNVEKTSDDEYRGFFDFMKSYFNRDKSVKKAKNVAEENKIKTFQQRMQINDIAQNLWRVADTLIDTIRDIVSNNDIKTKKAEIDRSVDEFVAYIKQKTADIDDLKKSDEAFFIEPNKIEEGEKNMIKTELEKALKEILEPIEQKISELEKAESSQNLQQSKEELQKNDIIDVIKEQFKPLEDRIATIENARGISKQVSTDEPIKTSIKKENIFSGLQF